MMIETGATRSSTASLLGEALSQTSRLVAAEVQLARLEMSEKISTAVKAVIAIVVAAIFLLVAMIFLLSGLVALLVHLGLSGSNANFAVGGAIAVVAIIAIIAASRSLSASKLKPGRSMRQMSENTAMMKESAR